jgi:hypothetical protein
MQGKLQKHLLSYLRIPGHLDHNKWSRKASWVYRGNGKVLQTKNFGNGKVIQTKRIFKASSNT